MDVEIGSGVLRQLVDHLNYVVQSQSGHGSVTIHVRNHRVLEDLDVTVRRKRR